MAAIVASGTRSNVVAVVAVTLAVAALRVLTAASEADERGPQQSGF
eukprot:CAMPEP_0176321956 /NCGR_PEP_ID=MMETSP0121_2-20121125/71616_1 /TAXON_ID=160619 /ORGANISM="Kryptoperidinium foliaceum, Strain CCMP 1326" /LENGTH=45 /DNA_ID= /DNA_START= /DNA_END= /DNA_ORIENTATION=